MRVKFPDYYSEFSCTADRCEDTCCAGWQIMIDKHSMKKYRKALFCDPFRKELRKAVNWRENSFRQDEQKRCAFLNEKNLCNLYIGMGKDALCKTCRNYPRHIEEFENVREITLSLSCPEAAGIILRKTDKVTFVEKYKDTKEETFEDFDPFLYDILEAGRDLMIDMLQDRSKSIAQRCLRIAGMAGKMQQAVDDGQMFQCQSIFDEYENGTEQQKNYHLKNAFGFSKRIFSEVYKMERLREDWEQSLLESAYWLHGKDETFYLEQCREFEAWIKQNMPEMEIVCEQILVYFIATYFCGAVYDGRIHAKVWMAIISLYSLQELWKSSWLKNEKTLTMEDIIDVTYRFSRELEHSDQNLEEMEKFADRFFARVMYDIG